MSFGPPPLSRAPPSPRVMIQKANERTAIYFTISIIALSTIIITSHFVGVMLTNSYPNTRGMLPKSIVKTARFIRSRLLRKVLLFPSVGHGLVFAVYIVINITLVLQNLDLSLSRNWAQRMGWITTCNIALVTFLALKNTPLALLTAYSYERLNILHQCAGYCTVFFAILHAALMIGTNSKLRTLQNLLELDQIMGIVAGLAMMTLLVTALTLRSFRYEVFYIVHISTFMLILIAVGMHRPDLVTKSTYIIIFAACIWFSDRFLRGTKIIWYVVSNRATIYPLPRGGVRIVMARTPWRAVPGTHIFLWIPKVRPTETHPFTIISTNPLEVVVSSQDGFTRDLFSLASKSPGAFLTASCDGPYGTLPNFSKFDHAILIAGGSGATFSFGVALNLIHNLPSAGSKPVIRFIWVIRDHEMKNWFPKELNELSNSPLVNLTVYVTRSINASDSSPTSEKQVSSQIVTQVQTFENSDLNIPDPEKLESGSCSPTNPEFNVPVVLGRPDISATIRSIVGATEEHERTIIAACGPDSLMRETRVVVGDVVANCGKSVTLHCEQFGW